MKDLSILTTHDSLVSRSALRYASVGWILLRGGAPCGVYLCGSRWSQALWPCRYCWKHIATNVTQQIVCRLSFRSSIGPGHRSKRFSAQRLLRPKFTNGEGGSLCGETAARSPPGL